MHPSVWLHRILLDGWQTSARSALQILSLVAATPNNREKTSLRHNNIHPSVQTKSELRVNTLIISQRVVDGKSIPCSSDRRSCASRRSPAGQRGPSRADPVAERPPTSRSCGPWNKGPLQAAGRSWGGWQPPGAGRCAAPSKQLGHPELRRAIPSSSLHPEGNLSEPLLPRG